MNNRIALSVLTLIIAITLSCGHKNGNNPLGVVGGGANGYGNFGGSTGLTVAQDLLGTWRDNLDSQYYRQYKFNSNGTCEIWHFDVEINFHEMGLYAIETFGETNYLTIWDPRTIFDGAFYFDHGDLVFVGDGGNFVFHRVR